MYFFIIFQSTYYIYIPKPNNLDILLRAPKTFQIDTRDYKCWKII